jgi:hypothetical protein
VRAALLPPNPPSEVAAKLAERAELLAAFEEARADAAVARSAARSAADEDTAAYAAAVRAGRADPGTPAADAAAAAIDEADRRVSAVTEALRQVDGEVDAVVRDQAEPWLSTTEALLVDEVDRARRLAATTVEAVESICELLGARSFLGDPSAGRGYKPTRAFSGFDKPNGEPLPLPAVLGELLVWLDRIDPTT